MTNSLKIDLVTVCTKPIIGISPILDLSASNSYLTGNLFYIGARVHVAPAPASLQASRLLLVRVGEVSLLLLEVAM